MWSTYGENWWGVLMGDFGCRSTVAVAIDFVGREEIVSVGV